MQRNPALSSTSLSPAPRRRAMAFNGGARALGLVLAATGLQGEALAQQSPDTFTLPEPTPSPTPAPQGPTDERSGVPIPPRPITPERAKPSPTPAPTPAPAPGPAEASPAQPPGSAPRDETFGDAFPPEGPQERTRPRAQSGVTRPSASPTPPARTRTDQIRAAGASTAAPLPIEQRAQEPIAPDANRSVREGEWVDVGPGSASDLAPSSTNQPSSPIETSVIDASVIKAGFLKKAGGIAIWLWALLALGLIALGALVWRALRTQPEETDEDGQILTSGARKELEAAYDIGSGGKALAPPPEGLRIDTLKEALAEALEENPQDNAPSAAPSPVPLPASPPTAPPATPVLNARPAPVVAPSLAEPPRLALSLVLTSARRSVMMFTVEYRLTIANRTDKAARNLTVLGRLACAKSDAADPANRLLYNTLGEIERIGPQQSHTLMGSLELAIADVRMMRQGAVSVFIPLMHVTIEAGGAVAIAERFVIGTPSEQNPNRLHPIALNARIGGIAGLRANRITPPLA